MSTLAYAALTNRRDASQPGTSTTTSAPGVRAYIDALSALVPAEVLTLHALILPTTTATKIEGGQTRTVITEPQTLKWSFGALILLSVGLYVVPRLRKWDRLDFVRAAVPPAAFVTWTMLQRSTAFDAVAPAMASAPRTVVALFAAVLLGLVAGGLAVKADRKPV